VLALAAPVERALAKPENGAVASAGKRPGKPVIYMRDPDLGVSRPDASVGLYVRILTRHARWMPSLPDSA
jgi:hypothetical protein